MSCTTAIFIPKPKTKITSRINSIGSKSEILPCSQAYDGPHPALLSINGKRLKVSFHIADLQNLNKADNHSRVGMVDLGAILRLLRPTQWYKNLLVFVALFFSQNLFNTANFILVLIAFASLCSVSSACYVLNDIADAGLDALHPAKRSRPIASGKVTLTLAGLLVLILMTAGFGLSLLLPTGFTYTLLAIFVVAQLYTMWLKREAFADVITLATGFVLRAVAGCFAIGVWISPWLITVVFFLAMFLVIGKRISDRQTFKELALNHRSALHFYDETTSKTLILISTACLLIAYTLYTFFGMHKWLFVTLPIVIYAVFRYLHFIQTNSRIAMRPELVFKDARMLLAITLWLALALATIYLDLFPK